MSQQTQTKILRESLAKYLQLRKDEHLLWNQQKEKMWGHLANRVPTPLNHSPSSLRSYCSLGLFCGDYAEHIQPVVYLDFPTIAYQFLYAQGVEEKQRYSVDIKIKDTRNLSVSKKLNPPDSTLPSIELGWIPALHVGNCINWLAAGSKSAYSIQAFLQHFLRMVLLKRQDPAWNIHLFNTNHHFRSKIIYTSKHISHVSM